MLTEAGICKNSHSSFVDSMLLDLKYGEHNVRKIPLMTSNFYVKLFVVSVAVLTSNIVYLWKVRNKAKIDFSNVKYIFLPFSDRQFIRFKHIPSIFEKDFAIVYSPAFHVQDIIKHLEYFRNRNIPVLTPNFGLKIFLKFLYYSIKKSIKFLKVSRMLRKEFSYNEKNSFELGVIIALLHQVYMKDFVAALHKVNHSKIIWFFDFDKDYKYIAFNSVIKNARHHDRTVHLQHGLFWGNDLCYTSPNVDFIFCCSKRERKIISATISDSDRILVTGAPLQSFDNMLDLKGEYESPEYDYLLVLTSCYDKSVFKLQSEVLTHFRRQDLDHMVRLRPMSKLDDIEKLDGLLKKNRISSNTTLSEDIGRARCVISFSEDSLLECFRCKKPTLFGNPLNLEFMEDKYLNDIPFKIFNNLSDLEKLLYKFQFKSSHDFYADDYIKDNFGEFDFEILKRNMLESVNRIMSL